jgi:uncharacterized SAM-binding protein YcdF (DUF218 family)
MPPGERTPYTYDVIVVLGAAVWPGGRPSPALERRVTHAVRLFRAHQAPVLLMTGGLGRHPPHEATLMRALALAQGVPAPSIVMEDRATSTFESGMYCAALCAQRGWTTLLVVTDGYHLPRSLLTFRSFGMCAVGSAVPHRWRRARKRWCTYGREIAAYCWYCGLLAARRLRHGRKHGRER